MESFSVSVDLSNLLDMTEQSGIFNNLSAAVERIAMTGAERWREAALKAPLWDGERKAYADSIEVRNTGPYSAEIISDYRYVEDIETGRPPRDLKKMLDFSMKVRVSKKGRRYLIIPMRHNTPGNGALAKDMPSDVYEKARALKPSKITGQGTRESGTGAFDIKTHKPFLVNRNTYKWGGRLPAGTARKLRTEHKTDPYAGMVRFEAKTLGSKKRYSTYLTFRVMAEGQTGWIIPAQPGLHIAEKIANGLMTDAQLIFGQAIRADLMAAS